MSEEPSQSREDYARTRKRKYQDTRSAFPSARYHRATGRDHKDKAQNGRRVVEIEVKVECLKLEEVVERDWVGRTMSIGVGNGKEVYRGGWVAERESEMWLMLGGG